MPNYSDEFVVVMELLVRIPNRTTTGQLLHDVIEAQQLSHWNLDKGICIIRNAGMGHEQLRLIRSVGCVWTTDAQHLWKARIYIQQRAKSHTKHYGNSV